MFVGLPPLIRVGSFFTIQPHARHPVLSAVLKKFADGDERVKREVVTKKEKGANASPILFRYLDQCYQLIPTSKEVDHDVITTKATLQEYLSQTEHTRGYQKVPLEMTITQLEKVPNKQRKGNLALTLLHAVCTRDPQKPTKDKDAASGTSAETTRTVTITTPINKQRLEATVIENDRRITLEHIKKILGEDAKENSRVNHKDNIGVRISPVMKTNTCSESLFEIRVYREGSKILLDIHPISDSNCRAVLRVNRYTQHSKDTTLMQKIKERMKALEEQQKPATKAKTAAKAANDGPKEATIEGIKVLTKGEDRHKFVKRLKEAVEPGTVAIEPTSPSNDREVKKTITLKGTTEHPKNLILDLKTLSKANADQYSIEIAVSTSKKRRDADTFTLTIPTTVIDISEAEVARLKSNSTKDGGKLVMTSLVHHLISNKKMLK